MNSDELQTLSIAPETDLAHYGMRWERARGKLSERQHLPTKSRADGSGGAAVGSVDAYKQEMRSQDSDLTPSAAGDFEVPRGFTGSKPAALMMARPRSSGENTNSAAGAGLWRSSSGAGVTKR